MKIAVDFDGTIVEDKYPNIGKEIPFAIETLKKLQERGHLIILWTYREGKELQEAIDYCKKRGLEFYAVNKNFPEEKPEHNMPRKINADIYIDDRNIGGIPEWGVIWQMITNENLEFYKKKSKNFFSLFIRFLLRHFFCKMK